jgi:Na+/melibiose symporter-like transporter
LWKNVEANHFSLRERFLIHPKEHNGFIRDWKNSCEFVAKIGQIRKEDSMTKQTLKILPITSLGKWSVGLIVAMPLLFIIGTSFTNSLYKSIPAGSTILADIAARPALALTMLAGIVAGILAFITGLLAIIRQKERALLVYVSGVIGALLMLFLAGEILFPH